MNGFPYYIVELEQRTDAVNISLSLPATRAYDTASLRSAAPGAEWGQQPRQVSKAFRAEKTTSSPTADTPPRKEGINRQLSQPA
jgi:hypothetical protein